MDNVGTENRGGGFLRETPHLCLLSSVLSVMLLCIGTSALGGSDETFGFDQGLNQMMSSYPSEPSGIVINNFLGADRFYNAGIFGQSAIAANVEPGHIWPGHETLGHVTNFSHHYQAYGSTTSDLYDRHATWVGMIIGGRKGGAVQGDYQTGISPGVDLRSGAFASSWSGSAYTMSFSFTSNSFTTPFNAYFGTADVINCSWAGVDPTGTSQYTKLLDGMVYSNPRTTYVVVAGNAGPGTNTVGWPGSGYNAITVGGLGGANAYDSVASFSSRGPQDYSDPVNGTVTGVRAAVDISAPAMSIKTAYYGGQTGGNNPSLSGSPSGIPGNPSSYTVGLYGTSLAAPIVTGGAALLASASYNTPALSGNADSRDGRVIKAVLLNSATKTSGWNNGQTPFGAGVETTQALDYKVGAGRINLDGAYDQYLSGTMDVPGQGSGNLGTVQTGGWDFGRIIDSTDNDYYINTQLAWGTTFTATLTWFRDRSSIGQAAYDNGQSDLDLIIFDAIDGTFVGEVSRSISDYNVVEHLYFRVPHTGFYGIRVRFDEVLFGTQTSEDYGLAWWAPTHLPGDANGDGMVSADDYGSVQANFGNTGDSWIPGDANGTGTVSADDYASVQLNFGNTLEMGGATVPEPATLSLLVMGGLVMLRRRSAQVLRRRWR